MTEHSAISSKSAEYAEMQIPPAAAAGIVISGCTYCRTSLLDVSPGYPRKINIG